MPKSVVHCKKDRYDVYIGRPSVWGNPWGITKDSKADFFVCTREEAVANYEKWLKGEDFSGVLSERRMEILRRLPELKGKTLGCWCSPKICHGDILEKMANGSESDSARATTHEESQDSTAADGRA